MRYVKNQWNKQVSYIYKKNVTALWGVETQKVFLAMAYAGQADILLFDEPTTYLDISCRIDLLNAFSELRKNGKTLITVLHDLNYALKISDYIIVMNQGKVISYGTPDEIFESHVIDKIFRISTPKILDQFDNSHYVTNL